MVETWGARSGNGMGLFPARFRKPSPVVLRSCLDEGWNRRRGVGVGLVARRRRRSHPGNCER